MQTCTTAILQLSASANVHNQPYCQPHDARAKPPRNPFLPSMPGLRLPHRVPGTNHTRRPFQCHFPLLSVWPGTGRPQSLARPSTTHPRTPQSVGQGPQPLESTPRPQKPDSFWTVGKEGYSHHPPAANAPRANTTRNSVALKLVTNSSPKLGRFRAFLRYSEFGKARQAKGFRLLRSNLTR